ncbi:MAG: hypothetical protein ACE5DW_02320 [Thermodesulfobacteriota bacterium]
MKFKSFSLHRALKAVAIAILLCTFSVPAAKAATDRHGREVKEPHTNAGSNKWKTWDKRYYESNASNVDYLKRVKQKPLIYKKLPKNARYEEECSACHFLYQPWLLPARSWELIIGNNKDHFGEDLSLEDDALKEILNYLVEYSTENTKVRKKWARKILRDLPPEPPESIRDVPYIKRKHRKLFRRNVFQRSSINSFANCVACHKTAPKGDYDDDHVKIPKK